MLSKYKSRALPLKPACSLPAERTYCCGSLGGGIPHTYMGGNEKIHKKCYLNYFFKKAIPLYAMYVLVGGEKAAPTHSTLALGRGEWRGGELGIK